MPTVDGTISSSGKQITFNFVINTTNYEFKLRPKYIVPPPFTGEVKLTYGSMMELNGLQSFHGETSVESDRTRVTLNFDNRELSIEGYILSNDIREGLFRVGMGTWSSSSLNEGSS
ncbi:hypothetical protein BYT27DRAFT_7202889 [Phlegmacium glaucopus]|nr:hypothetical protein BYT27DRAFT_7202889 [Phlegmacium glaucopus]